MNECFWSGGLHSSSPYSCLSLYKWPCLCLCLYDWRYTCTFDVNGVECSGNVTLAFIEHCQLSDNVIQVHSNILPSIPNRMAWSGGHSGHTCTDTILPHRMVQCSQCNAVNANALTTMMDRQSQFLEFEMTSKVLWHVRGLSSHHGDNRWIVFLKFASFFFRLLANIAEQCNDVLLTHAIHTQTPHKKRTPFTNCPLLCG